MYNVISMNYPDTSIIDSLAKLASFLTPAPGEGISEETRHVHLAKFC